MNPSSKNKAKAGVLNLKADEEEEEVVAVKLTIDDENIKNTTR